VQNCTTRGFAINTLFRQMRVIEQKNKCGYVTNMKRSTVPWELSWPYTTASDATQTQQTTQSEQRLNFRYISMQSQQYIRTTDVTKWNTFLCNISYTVFLIKLSSNSISGQTNTHLHKAHRHATHNAFSSTVGSYSAFHPILTHWGREGSFKLFKLFKRPFPGFLTILTL